MANTQSDVDLGHMVRMLRRRASFIVSIIVVMMAGATVIVAQLPKWYAAEAVVQLDSRNSIISDLQSVTSKLIRGLQSDTTVIRTETDLMKVPAMAERVITDMNLLDDPELNAPTMSWFHWWQQLVLDNAWIDRTFPWLASLVESQTPDNSVEYRLTRAVRQLEKRLTVSNEGGSYLLTIRFEAKDPKLAAGVANKFAELYLKDQQAVKLETTRSANEWLGGRLVDLRNKVVESERLVASFQEQHHLAETKGVTLTAQQLSEVTSQLVGVSAEVVQAQANLEAAQRTMRAASGAAGVAQVLASPLIQTLRKSEADVQRREAELSSKYLPDHPLLSEVEAERRNLEAKIDQEIGKVVAALKSDLNVAQTREAKLRARFNELQQQQAELTTADVELRELEREANANRTLYASFLEKFKETSAQEDSQQPDARLVSKAEVPLEPSFPNRPLLLFSAFLAASGAAVIIALVIGWLRPGITNPEVLRGIRRRAQPGAPSRGQMAHQPDQPDAAAALVALSRDGAVGRLRTAMHAADDAVQGGHGDIVGAEGGQIGIRALARAELGGVRQEDVAHRLRSQASDRRQDDAGRAADATLGADSQPVRILRHGGA